jgi:hypothetical protein
MFLLACIEIFTPPYFGYNSLSEQAVLLVYVSFDSGRTFLLAWWDGLHHI